MASVRRHTGSPRSYLNIPRCLAAMRDHRADAGASLLWLFLAEKRAGFRRRSSTTYELPAINRKPHPGRKAVRPYSRAFQTGPWVGLA